MPPDAQLTGAGTASDSSSPDELQHRIADLITAIEARDTFIAVTGHELRNALTPITGQIDLLLSTIRAGRCTLDKAEQKLEGIQYAARRYIRRTGVLLDVSRINGGRLRLDVEPCDMAALVRGVANEFAEAARRTGVPISFRVPDNLPGSWDRMAVEQILDNLISNALKYGDRTPIELTAEIHAEEIRVQVRDHGNGIPPGERERVFGRFERAVGSNDRRSGFGVGLWLVRHLAEAMGGTVTIEDALGGGAMFTVTLPQHRGGSVCLNSSWCWDRWSPAGFRLPRSAGAG